MLVVFAPLMPGCLENIASRPSRPFTERAGVSGAAEVGGSGFFDMPAELAGSYPMELADRMRQEPGLHEEHGLTLWAGQGGAFLERLLHVHRDGSRYPTDKAHHGGDDEWCHCSFHV